MVLKAEFEEVLCPLKAKITISIFYTTSMAPELVTLLNKKAEALTRGFNFTKSEFS